MKKLESSLKNMVLSLTLITLVAAAALGGVYLLTEAQINRQKAEQQNAAEIAVLHGEEGVAIETQADGFGGKIRIMVGFAPDGTILGYEILEQQETPGLGTHIVEWFKNADKPAQNIVGRKATGSFAVSKDGGDVDAITAATISSRAFLKAINQAYNTFAIQQGWDVNATTGASQLHADTLAPEQMNAPERGRHIDHERRRHIDHERCYHKGRECKKGGHHE